LVKVAVCYTLLFFRVKTQVAILCEILVRIIEIPTINVKNFAQLDFSRIFGAHIAQNLAKPHFPADFRRQENLRRIRLLFGGLPYAYGSILVFSSATL